MQEHRTAGTNYKSGGISVWKQVWRLLLLLFQCPSLSCHPRDGHLSNWRWEEDIMLEPSIQLLALYCLRLIHISDMRRHYILVQLGRGADILKWHFFKFPPKFVMVNYKTCVGITLLYNCPPLLPLLSLSLRWLLLPGGCRQSWQISRLQIWKIQQGNNIQVRILFAIYWLLVCLLSCSQTDWIRQSDLVQDTPLLQKESFTKWEFQHLQSCSFSVYL